jgi:AraC-like DNA-binding protein
VQLSSPQEVIDVFELLQREGMNESGLGAQNCAALLPFLVMKINQHAIPYGTLDFRAVETYERAKRMMEENFLSLRSLKEAARACHVDPSYLSRLFQRFGHLTPYRFITKLKMNFAATLLLDERMLVKEVAEKLGFADAFHFSRTFKRVYGISPERFVRQSRAVVSRPANG